MYFINEALSQNFNKVKQVTLLCTSLVLKDSLKFRLHLSVLYSWTNALHL